MSQVVTSPYTHGADILDGETLNENKWINKSDL